jgi:hypothetical protein
MQTKLSAVKNHMRAGQWQEAIRLAARFPRLGSERAAILDAHGAYTNPRFLTQVGKDIDALKRAGQQALLERYGIG